MGEQKVIRYVGNHDVVYIPLPDGRRITVERNHQVTVDAELAEGLLKQEDNWHAVEAKSSKDARIKGDE